MQPFAASLQTLVAGLDPAAHAHEIALLERCTSTRDLTRLAETDRGFLTPSGPKQRLRLVKHHSGTFLVLSFEEGWGTTLCQADFWSR